jgi:hypothetical protein
MKKNAKISIVAGIVIVILVALGIVGAATSTTTTTQTNAPSSQSAAITTSVVTSVSTLATSSSNGGTSYSFSSSSSSAFSSPSSSIVATSSISSALTISSLTASSTSFVMPLSCHSINGLPDPNCTPGAINQNVTQDNIQTTICKSGWTATIRPSSSYTNKLKVQSIQLYGYADTNLSNYEEDHLIPLEVGGNPMLVQNLWAEPHYGNYTSLNKDGFENYLNAMVCNGKMPLIQAQQEIATNWVQSWVAAGEPKGSAAAGD